MSVIRRGPQVSSLPGKGGSTGIPVKCPKCQETIEITEFKGNKPIRCPRCSYPMIRRTDLLLIAAACKKLKNANQTRSAVGILKRMSEYLPEAGEALGALANQYTLPISDIERWNWLNGAYAAGDENAREWLDRMCQSNPGSYRQSFCEKCGAPKYYARQQAGSSLCKYCQSAD